ncbi:MAG: hypothetical protein EPO24_16095 [Bacteroidetes bacterium]|nr:MAG: hypothetical protein EPO24_16095 [Bacteroidota bacterium]
MKRMLQCSGKEFASPLYPPHFYDEGKEVRETRERTFTNTGIALRLSYLPIPVTVGGDKFNHF